MTRYKQFVTLVACRGASASCGETVDQPSVRLVPSGPSWSGTTTAVVFGGKLLVLVGEQRSGRRLSTAATLWPLLSKSSFGTRGLPA